MLSLNGITNYGDVHADTLNVKNASGSGWDDVKTLIAAATGITDIVAGSNITVSGSGSSRTIASTAAGGGTILQLGGTTQAGATTLNVAANIGASANNVLSIAAQPVITSTSDLAMQDLTCRNLTASGSTFTIKGGVITYIQDNLGANIMDIQASRVEFLKQVNLTQPATAYTAFTLHDVTGNRSGQLWITGTGKLQWAGQEVVDLPTLLGLLASKITAGTGLSAIANNQTGAVQLSLNQSFAHSFLNFNGTSKTLRNVTNNSVDELTWGSESVATQPWVTSGLAAKQDNLNYLSETQAPANVDLSNETASTPVYIAWPGFTAPAVVNATGYQSLNAVYKEYNSLTAGATIYFQADFKAGTTSSVILSVNNTTTWTGNLNTVISGLSTTAWKSVQWSFPVYSNGKFNLHVGLTPAGMAAQPAGTVLVRNFRLSTTPNVSAFTSKVTVQHDIVCSSNITAVAVTQTSDRRIKQGIEDASLDDLQAIFDNVEAKTYTRTDIEGNRLGFIAQDVQEKLPPDIGNLVYMNYEQDQPLLALDYSRLVCCLWGVTKRLQQRIEALEAPKKKKTVASK